MANQPAGTLTRRQLLAFGGGAIALSAASALGVGDLPVARAALLPAPFSWIDIPAGKVNVGHATFAVPAFQMAKYPITNAQFNRFVKAGGYQQARYWTAEGWQARSKGQTIAGQHVPWRAPMYWADGRFNGPDQPVVGVSWHEAAAYCAWLSQSTGQNISLPTEQQWQWAAQGDDGRQYPWGDRWEGDRCNNSIIPTKHGFTSPVATYDGRGESCFGVADMAGNVWEWCHTNWHTNEVEATVKALRGGSWMHARPDVFRSAYRYWERETHRNALWGFRLVRLISV
jgi:formylglycine-generating enzyme required for sulfatase activity